MLPIFQQLFSRLASASILLLRNTFQLINAMLSPVMIRRQIINRPSSEESSEVSLYWSLSLSLFYAWNLAILVKLLTNLIRPVLMLITEQRAMISNWEKLKFTLNNRNSNQLKLTMTNTLIISDSKQIEFNSHLYKKILFIIWIKLFIIL